MTYYESDGDSFEDMRSLEQELTFISVEEHFSKRKVVFDVAKMQTLGMVSHDGVYTNLALLLSDQCKSSIKAAMFEGINQSVFQDRREFEGSLFQQMDELYAYLDMRNQTKATFEGLYRTDKRDYPEEALREALMNSIVHRDYSYSASTLVSIYDDRIEFVSVGGLPIGIELDDIMLGLSICRNPKLASVFYRLELIEAYGTGIPKILNAYANDNIKPRIEVSHNAFKITLPNRNANTQSFDNSTPKSSVQEEVLRYAQDYDSITRTDVENILNVSQATANRTLKRMVSSGLLYQEGRGKMTRYKRAKK